MHSDETRHFEFAIKGNARYLTGEIQIILITWTRTQIYFTKQVVCEEAISIQEDVVNESRIVSCKLQDFESNLRKDEEMKKLQPG